MIWNLAGLKDLLCYCLQWCQNLFSQTFYNISVIFYIYFAGEGEEEFGTVKPFNNSQGDSYNIFFCSRFYSGKQEQQNRAVWFAGGDFNLSCLLCQAWMQKWVGQRWLFSCYLGQTSVALHITLRTVKLLSLETERGSISPTYTFSRILEL